MSDIIRRINLLEQRLDGLEQPEVGRWIDWTPTVDQNGNVAITITYARYIILGRVVHLRARLAVTGSGTGGNAISISGLPTNIQPVNPSGMNIIGTGSLSDSGTTVYVGAMAASGADDLRIRIDQAGTGFLGSTPSVALANGDVIGFQATYER